MEEYDVYCCKTEFWVFLCICLVLVSFAGITSGLALGLLSFSQVDLEVLIKAGQPQERKNAAKIQPLVKNEHLLLCTLLVGKSLAMEALPMFLDSIFPSWAAILISATLVLACAEIIPQAVCSRYGLGLGAKLCTFVRLLLVIFFPVAYPISKLLDWLLGKEHSALYRRAELKTLVDLHAAGKGGELSRHETTIITGALDLTQKTAKDAMTPISETFSVDINSKLDMHTMGLIMSRGHSRIPVYSGSPQNIIGLILGKNLIFCRPEDETPIKYMTIRRIPRVFENWPLYDILHEFQKGHSHMAVVIKNKKDVEDTEKRGGGKHSVLDIDVNPHWNKIRAERKGLYSPLGRKERMSISATSSPLYSSDTDHDHTPTPKNIMEQEKFVNPQQKRWVQESENVLFENLESIRSNSDEEVIGIITMEDVMEELLQEDILDETDEYVDVHNKIRINLRSSRRSSSRSPRRSSASHINWRTPEPSPLSSYAQILRSPIPPYVQPPLARPTLYASPGGSILNSPAGSAGCVHSSPSSHRVSRKLYEKLLRTGNS